MIRQIRETRIQILPHRSQGKEVAACPEACGLVMKWLRHIIFLRHRMALGKGNDMDHSLVKLCSAMSEPLVG